LWELLSQRLGSTAFTETFPDYAMPDPVGIFKPAS
jgi:hypothetical protein